MKSLTELYSKNKPMKFLFLHIFMKILGEHIKVFLEVYFNQEVICILESFLLHPSPYQPLSDPYSTKLLTLTAR